MTSTTRRTSGEGSISLRQPAINGKPARWEVKVPAPYDENGRRKSVSRIVWGTRADAVKKIGTLLGHLEAGTLVKPDTMKFIEHLRSWLARKVAPSKAPNTLRCYTNVVDHIENSSLALVPVQALRSSHLEAYLAGVSPWTASLHRTVLSSSLKLAVRDELIRTSPAIKLELPTAPENVDAEDDSLVHCWDEQEVAKFLDHVKTLPSMGSSFYQLALDIGARRNELLGLTWPDLKKLEQERGHVVIRRQLHALNPVAWRPIKTWKTRKSVTVSLSRETTAALLKHRAEQRALRLRSGATYRDHGLVFCRTPEHVYYANQQLGDPLEALATWMFYQTVKEAGVRRIKFHGIRHTVASIALGAGVRVEVVAARLGDKITTVQNTYAHVLPDYQDDAAERLARVYHRR